MTMMMMMMKRPISAITGCAVAALVAACAHAPTTSSSTGSTAPGSSSASAGKPAPNAATKAASTKANLAVEKLRLGELFRGTPVVISLQPDGSLRADVPLHFSFDPGKSAVKPPLAAVLDRVASGQVNEITHLVIAAPADPPPVKSPTLVGERATAVRDYLVGRGLAASRLAVTGAAAGVVRVVVTDTAAP
jgi:outer membrane protein OmpA-like peptidoglycan-associated protein